MFPRIHRRFGVKIFLSYLVVLAVGLLVMAAVLQLAIPGAFTRHMVSMDMGGMMMGEGMGSGMMGTSLFRSFQLAVWESLGWASFALVVTAVAVSAWVSRRVVAPVLEMTRASRRIASGRYGERVNTGDGYAEDELETLAVSFNQMAEKLEHTETMRRQLLGDVAHELRTPLTAIKGSLEGLLDGVLPAEPETYHEIYREADRLQRMVADLQELSRVEAGAVPLQFQDVSIRALVESTTRRLKPQFDDKGVRLVVNYADQLPRVKADPDRITQVLVNLVGNALQYTPAGEEVMVSVEQVSDRVQVTVQDTGIGILQEDLPHLFDRFYRADKARVRTAGGSGIGLTIAKYLVEAHGGEIHARSDGLNRGSSFSFTLPLQGGIESG